MSHSYRIGCNLQLNDSYWVQLNEAMHQRAAQLGLAIIPIDLDMNLADPDAQLAAAEEVLIQDLDALIGWRLPDVLLFHLLDNHLPIIHLHWREFHHPLLTTSTDLYDVGILMAQFLATELNQQGRVLMIGGGTNPLEDGSCRLNGYRDTISEFPQIETHHIPCSWRAVEAQPTIADELDRQTSRYDAIFGLSDSLALTGRDLCLERGLISEQTPVVGINGDPHALAAIARGQMRATIDTYIIEYGQMIAEQVLRAVKGEPLTQYFGPSPRRLVTAENVATVAAEKLIGIAEIPNRLVGVNVQQERQRLRQLETSLAINAQIGTLLDRRTLAQQLAELVRHTYDFDLVRVLLWSEREQALIDESNGAMLPITAETSGLLAEVMRGNQLCFVPNIARSQRFPPDPAHPRTCSRVALPMRVGDTVIGLLDLHNERLIHHGQAELIGLQVLADQVAVTLRNAELVTAAETSRATAEKADRLKTLLLANVSHELRTPLNVIMGYSQTALSSPRAHYDLSPQLRQDLQYIYQSGEHLMRLINDLLDLSRAEIDELELFPETIGTAAFLREVFTSFVESIGNPAIEWHLELPEALPLIQADPLRLRQVLLNLLANAARFTPYGCVELGAAIEPPLLRIWIRDTGVGIAPDLQWQIFEPFVTSDHHEQRPSGIGLGLSIARRLVLLHRGSIEVESMPGNGSTFHIRLPLPALEGTAINPLGTQPALLLLGAETPAISELCARQNLQLQPLTSLQELDTLLKTVQPTVIAWSMARASSDDWAILARLRSHALCRQLPFLIFGDNTSSSMTQILSKPTSTQTLADALAVMQPRSNGAILVVDDDAHTCELYRRLINEALPYYEVIVAGSGRTALELLEHGMPSLVILDLSLPELDGFDVLAQMRAQPSTRDIPVLVISSRALSHEDIGRLNHAGVIFQTKDLLEPEETIQVLRQTLNGERGLPPHTSVLVRRAVAYVQHHYTRQISRQEIADAIGVSKNYLSEIFHAELGISPWEYLNRYRIQRAKELLLTTNSSITSVASQVGFGDSSYFGRVFHRHVGRSPSEYRN